MLNAVAAAAGWTVSFVSFTVPQYQRAESYFAPLARLATGPDTELNFGIVPYHPGDQMPGGPALPDSRWWALSPGRVRAR
ncbi:MAG: hypothetical protein WB688_06200 [Trebonia sp.]